jgi:hypothetical protein
MDVIGFLHKTILEYTVPGFATSERTLQQARRLVSAIGCEAHEIDIRPSCLQMQKGIGHRYSTGQPLFDTTFENVQAGERTSHLFRLANQFCRPARITEPVATQKQPRGWLNRSKCQTSIRDGGPRYLAVSIASGKPARVTDPFRIYLTEQSFELGFIEG